MHISAFSKHMETHFNNMFDIDGCVCASENDAEKQRKREQHGE